MATFYTATEAVTFSDNTGLPLVSTTFTYVTDSESGIDDTVASMATNMEYDLPIVVAAVHCLLMWSSEAVTVLTNSSSVPQDTIHLVANKPLVWDTDMVFAIPFVGNVTKLFVSNAGSFPASFKVRVFSKLTP